MPPDGFEAISTKAAQKIVNRLYVTGKLPAGRWWRCILPEAERPARTLAVGREVAPDHTFVMITRTGEIECLIGFNEPVLVQQSLF